MKRLTRRKRTVVFTVPNPNICAGACIDVQVTFTGAPPFTLHDQSNPGIPQTQIFTGTSGLLQVCAPVGATAETLVLNVLSLSDAFCSCLEWPFSFKLFNVWNTKNKNS